MLKTKQQMLIKKTTKKGYYKNGALKGKKTNRRIVR